MTPPGITAQVTAARVLTYRGRVVGVVVGGTTYGPEPARWYTGAGHEAPPAEAGLLALAHQLLVDSDEGGRTE
jgi:hypothetical protein